MDSSQYANLVTVASAFLLFVMVAFAVDKRIWARIDSGLAIILGVFFVFAPGFVLDFSTEGSLLENSLVTCRMFGAVLIGSTIIWRHTSDTRDGTVPITLMMARVFTTSIHAMATLYTLYGTDKGKKNVKWITNDVSYDLALSLAWCIGSLIQLLRDQDFSTYPQHNVRINSHLRIEALFTLIVSLVFLAFPDLVMNQFFNKAPNCVETHFLRCTGISFLGAFVISLQAPGFLHEKDKRAQFICTLATVLIWYAPVVHGVVQLEMFTWKQVGVTAGLVCPLIVNSLLGYCSEGASGYKLKHD